MATSVCCQRPPVSRGHAGSLRESEEEEDAEQRGMEKRQKRNKHEAERHVKEVKRCVPGVKRYKRSLLFVTSGAWHLFLPPHPEEEPGTQTSTASQLSSKMERLFVLVYNYHFTNELYDGWTYNQC